jgi:UDP-N-acetylmuramate--alanine ligase
MAKTKKQSKSRQKVHFIGLGGIGTSSLARWFLAQKWAVSGSDLSTSSTTQELQKEGVKVKIGHKKANLPQNTSLVVYSNAISPRSPGYVEYEGAEKQGLRLMSYPQALGCLTETYKTIAIAGSHGKSTTTSIIGLILKNSSFAPTIIVGTKLKELNGKNFHLGKTHILDSTFPPVPSPKFHEIGYLVIEADEWRGAFLNYHPDITLITNIDKEHLDFYRDLKDLKKTFLQFIAKTKPGGTLVLNRDDKNLLSLSPLVQKIARKKSLKTLWYSLKNKKDPAKIKKYICIPGRHNLSNALGAITVTQKVLGLKEAYVLKRLGLYQGAWRRMEYRGKMHLPSTLSPRQGRGSPKAAKPSPLVYDDYAHHPTEIKATLQAFREKFPKSKIICVYQPHQARRLKALYSEFIGAFKDVDTIIFLPIYEVAGRDKPDPHFTSEKLARATQDKNPKKKIIYLENPRDIKKELSEILSPRQGRGSPKAAKPCPLNPVVVMMGAGSINTYTPLLLDHHTPAKGKARQRRLCPIP